MSGSQRKSGTPLIVELVGDVLTYPIGVDSGLPKGPKLFCGVAFIKESGLARYSLAAPPCSALLDALPAGFT